MTTRNAPNARNARDTRTIVLAAAATAAVLASGQAQARSPVDVQWQVTIGSPAGGYPVPGGVVISAPVYLPPPVVVVVVCAWYSPCSRHSTASAPSTSMSGITATNSSPP